MTFTKRIAAVIVALLLGSGATLGGVYTLTTHEFAQGLKAGSANQLVIDASGNASTTGSVTVGSSYVANTIDTRFAYDDTLNSASTTVCSLLSPTATSTLEDASVHFSVSSSTASTVSFSKGTGFASTTLFQNYSVSANAQATINLFATTTSAGSDNLTFAPSTYFNVTMSGGTGTFSPTGECQAVFRIRS